MPVSLLDIAISVVGAGQAVGALQGLSQSALQAYASNEMLVKSLDALVAKQIAVSNDTTLTEARKQSLSLTKKLVDWTQRLGVQSPYSQEGIASAFKMAMAFGMSIDQAKQATEAVVDFAAASGQGPYEMEGIILAMGQAFSRGKLQGEEAMQMLERGVPVWEYLGRSIGKTTTEIQDMSSRGMIPAVQAFEALTQGMRQDFGGAAAEAGTTIQGLTSSFQDLITIAQRQVAAPSIQTLQPLAADAFDALSSDDVYKMIDRISLYLAKSTDKAIETIPQTIQEIAPFVETAALGIGISGGLAFMSGMSKGILPQMFGLTTGVLGAIATAVAHQVPGVLMNRALTHFGLPTSQMGALWMGIWNAPALYNRVTTSLSNIRNMVNTWSASVFGPGSRTNTAINNLFTRIQSYGTGVLVESARAAAWQAANQIAFMALPFAIGGVMASHRAYEGRISEGAQDVLNNQFWYTDSKEAIEGTSSVLVQAELALREYNREIRQHKKEISELQYQQRQEGLSVEEQTDISQRLGDEQRTMEQVQRKANKIQSLLTTARKHNEEAIKLQDEAVKRTKDTTRAADLVKSFGFLKYTNYPEIYSATKWLAKLGNDEIFAYLKREVIPFLTKEANKAQQASDELWAILRGEEPPDVSGKKPEPPAAFTEAQQKVADLATQQAEKLLGIREATSQKMEEQWDAYYEAEAEAQHQRNLSTEESAYQHNRAIEEARYQFYRSQAEAQRQWNYEQEEAARKHGIEMLEAERKRLLELDDLAQKQRPATQTALDDLAATEADFQRAATKRLEEWNKKRQLLARQGAMCKLPEEREAFEEQEQQAAEAYQKQEQQQRATLGRQLIDFTVAMALRNDVSAAAMEQMVAGIAQATGAYDSVTADLLGSVFAGITSWARSGGQSTAAVLANIRALPDAAREAKAAEEELSRTLRERAVEQFQRTGDVRAYQAALNAIPTQVATQLGLSTDEALSGSSVYQNQEQWLRQQEEMERAYQRQQEEANRAHQHQVEEDQRTHELDLEEMERQHRMSLAEEERQYQLDREEAWRKHLEVLEKMHGKEHQKQLEEAMRQGDRLMAEALAQAGSLDAAQRILLTGDYRAAMDYELKMQNWLTDQLGQIDYGNPKTAQQARESIYQSYAGLRERYQQEHFAPIDPQTALEIRRGRGQVPEAAPRYHEGAPLNLTVNLEADGLVLHTVQKTVRVVNGQMEELEMNGRQR